MRDFCSTADKECIRIIVAQDLKEFGIDIDSSSGVANFSSLQNTTNNNTSYNLTKQNGGGASANVTSKNSNHQILNTSGMHNSTNSNNFFHNTSNNFNIFQSTSSKNSSNNTTTTTANNITNSSSETCLDAQLSGGSKLFGIGLKQIDMVNLMVEEQTLNVPCFLKYAFEYINEFIHVEGIFRRNGTASRLKELKKQVEEGVYNFSQFAIFDLTSLIKLFFRELPESLLTFSLYSHFIQAVKLETTKSKLESILNLCLQLPDINLHVLIYLMHFLKQITLQETHNKMNSFNLAVCFAPNIIYTRINKLNDLYINEERIVVQLLIENSSLIGKISDSVYERSMMLNSLCCSTTIMMQSNNSANNTTNNPNTTNNMNECSKIDGKQTFVESNHNHHYHHHNQSSIKCSTSSSCINASSNANNPLIHPTLTNNNDLMFLYDNDLQENSSFALHHAQSAGSTSLSSYCGSSSISSKKEKKKRRSSSLKELMITIQNSISKFRRRSASEKNDKTTCSIITCTSMTTAGSSNGGLNIGDTTSCSSRFISDTEKQKLLGMDSGIGSNFLANTPYIGHVNSSNILGNCKTPMCASLYATPRINKRNAEDSLQSTTKKKLMEKLPQRNLLLPNAPITPFSTSKKSSKHPFRQLLSTSETTSNNNIAQSTAITHSQVNGNGVVGGLSLGSSASTQLSATNGSTKIDQSNKPPLASNISNNNPHLTTPQQMLKQQLQTPSTLKSTNNNLAINQTPAMGLHKQLRYEDSPSNMFVNQTCELGSFKPKYSHISIDKNLSLASADILVSSSLQSCKATSSLSSSCSKHHHGHHHHSHHNGSGGSSSHRHHDREHRHHGHHSHHHHTSSHHHHHNHTSGSSSTSSGHHRQHHHSHSHHKHSSSIKSSSSRHHHQYVNAMPSASHSNNSHSSSSSGNSSCASSSRFNKNTDLCTKIISGSNFNDLMKPSSKTSTSGSANLFHQTEINFNNDCLSTTSASNSSGSNNVSIEKNYLQHHLNLNFHNHTSACCGVAGHHTNRTSQLQESSLMGADSSMRCTLRRGRPNTPKSGLSVEYRIRKSSVPNTPEFKHASSKKINYTISNDDIQIKSSDLSNKLVKLKQSGNPTVSATRVEPITKTTSSASLNTAIIDGEDKKSINVDDLNDARWFDHDIDIDENIDLDENINDRQIIDIGDDEEEEEEEYNSSSDTSQLSTTKSAPSQSPSRMLQISNQNSSIGNRQLSLSLSNLPQASGITESKEDGENEKNSKLETNSNENIQECLQETEKIQIDNILGENDKENMGLKVKTETHSKSNESTLNENISITNVSQSMIEQQKNQIEFEPFEFKLPDDVSKNNKPSNSTSTKSNFECMLEQEQKLLINHAATNLADESLLQNVLRRQSLFKLKEKINGKVSKQINEIEQRKLSPYRFSNSPLKNRKSKDCSKSSIGSSGCNGSKSKHVSPIRVPSIFCKKMLAETPQDSYTVKTSKSRTNTAEKLSKTIAGSTTSKDPKIPNDSNSSPLLVRAANQFYKKLNRNRSIKRLNVTMSSNVSQTPTLASISENEYATPVLKPIDINKLESATNSPMGKQLLNVNEWKCSSESINL